MDDIVSGKINNKYDAEKEYVEKIINDEKLLRSYKIFSRNKDAQEISPIINDLEYALVGIFLPSGRKADDPNGGILIPPLSDLETEEEAEKGTPTRVKSLSESERIKQRQKQAEEYRVERIRTPPKGGRGLKIMTPSQLITRLSISLAQKQAGNNSNKNEIRQVIYS